MDLLFHMSSLSGRWNYFNNNETNLHAAKSAGDGKKIGSLEKQW